MNRFVFALALLAVVPNSRPLRAEGIEPDTSASDTAARRVTIRTYTVRELDRPSAETLALASTLLSEAGIDSRWVSCGVVHPDTGCALPMTSLELAMRLTHGPTIEPSSSAVAMGTSLIDRARRVGALATLYLDRIDALATATGTDVRVILARAITHEAAHLLLGTTEHSSTGIMRPLWSRDMVRHDPPSAWVFSVDEGRRMQQALAERIGAGHPTPVPFNGTR